MIISRNLLLSVWLITTFWLPSLHSIPPPGGGISALKIPPSIIEASSICSSSSTTTTTAKIIEDDFLVKKRDGSFEPLDKEKIRARLVALALHGNLDLRYVDIPALSVSIVRGMYPNVTTSEIDTLAAETAASMSTQHPHYAILAGLICATHMHRVTPTTFSEGIDILYQNGNGFINDKVADIVRRRKDEIDAQVDSTRDFNLTYFGLKTLQKSYLLKTEEGKAVERPQYLLMRVALGIHCVTNGENENENKNLQAAFETYDMMSKGYFTHASPTLFHAGTTHPQLSSCFLLQMSEDSINGIYDTLKRCAVISKSAGGIGLSAHNIRARGTYIKGTRGVSNGLVPMLRVFDVTSRYVDQGGGKRPGAFAVYLEPWHADIFDVLNLKKNHGKEEQRARDLFYGLWVPDLFMERVENDGKWSLMCPHQCQGLQSCHGAEFRRLYEQYEAEGRFVRQIRARDLWGAILDAQIETGTPYLLYKDAANEKSNQKNLGTIQSSNLCTEIIQYTDEEEVAVCNLACICIPKFVSSERGKIGSIDPESGKAYFDHIALHRAAKTVTRNLNKVIEVNAYPIPGAAKSNRLHRPIGIGVSGLADAFLRLGLPFASKEAKALNEAIFETIYHAALEASAELAEELGPYDSFAGSPASEGRLQFDLWGMKDEDTPSNRREPTLKFPRQVYPDDTRGYDWKSLKKRIKKTGLRNSLLLAPMPTASTSQILGVNECFEPFSSNLYLRRVKAGEFIMANPHLMEDLTDRGLWTPAVRNQLMRDGGSVANIDCIPNRLKELYKTVWEISMKDIIDMSADRGKFIDQSQSLNLFIADPTVDKLTAMHFYAWKKGLKTGMYYLRTKPAVNAIQYTVDKGMEEEQQQQKAEEEEVCLSCQG